MESLCITLLHMFLLFWPFIRVIPMVNGTVYFFWFLYMPRHTQGLPRWLSGKESPWNAGHTDSISAAVFLPGKSHEQRSLEGLQKRQTWLSDWVYRRTQLYISEIIPFLQQSPLFFFSSQSAITCDFILGDHQLGYLSLTYQASITQERWVVVVP